MYKWIDWIRKTSYAAFVTSAVLFIFMSLSVGYDVLMRNVFSKPTVWVNEISGYLLVIIAFLAAAFTLHEGGHVRVEFLEQKLSPKWGNLLYIFAQLVIAMYAIVITWKGAEMVWMSWKFQWKASTFLGTPLYIPQIFIPLGGALIALQAVALIVERLIGFNGKK